MKGRKDTIVICITVYGFLCHADGQSLWSFVILRIWFSFRLLYAIHS